MRDGFLHTDVSLKLSAQRRHSFTFDTAWHDVSEPRQVRVTVQSQAVRRDVAATVDSDGTDLVVSHPDPSMRRRGPLDPKPAADRDDGLLQLTDVPANTLLKAAQVQDWVTDQLTRPMECDESSSAGTVDIGTQQTEALQLSGGVWFVSDPRGVDGLVLTQQQSMSRGRVVPVHVDLLQL